MIRFGEEDMAILFLVRCFTDHGKIQQALVQLFRNLLRIPACDMIAQVRIELFERMDLSGKIADLIGLRETEVNIPAGDVVQR